MERARLLRLLGRCHVNHFATLVGSAVWAEPVWEDRFVALGAILDLDRGHMVVAPAVPFAGSGGASLGYGHDNSRGKSGLRNKTVILGRQAKYVKELGGWADRPFPVS